MLTHVRETGRRKLNLRVLVGSGDRIAAFVLPFLVAGVILNILFPAVFAVGGPPAVLQWVSVVMLIGGVSIWAWSAVLILTKVPRGDLITGGPYRVVKHPLYTAVALLVLPWIGFLYNTWLGAVIGIVMYIGSRTFAPAEERDLSKAFGAAWGKYRHSVKVPWL